VTFRYSASVGGSLPALETVTRAALHDAPHTIKGIVNGTCNFICDRMMEGSDFPTALDLAEKAGFTEANPSLDLNGTDAAQKLVLLTKAAFGIRIPFESIDRIGIADLDPSRIDEARKRGSIIRLVAECSRSASGIMTSVKPVELPSSQPFAQTKGADNCLLIESATGKRTWLRGRGAGRFATTESVMADLFDLKNEFVGADECDHLINSTYENRLIQEARA
jgi:homoserine dehydrogenase